MSDFGFAIRVEDDEELTGINNNIICCFLLLLLLLFIELLGTPGYLAPEMLTRSIDSTAPGYNKLIDL